MTPIQIVFLLIAGATLISAVMVVSARRIMHAALWLILALLGVAALFVTLETGFFATVQIVVYVGAIAILIIFAVMLTRRDQQEEQKQLNRQAGVSLLVAAAVAGGLIATLAGWQNFSALRAGGSLLPVENIESIAELGRLLVSPGAYVIPFEVASVLLIGALIGALYVAGEQKR